MMIIKVDIEYLYQSGLELILSELVSGEVYIIHS